MEDSQRVPEREVIVQRDTCLLDEYRQQPNMIKDATLAAGEYSQKASPEEAIKK